MKTVHLTKHGDQRIKERLIIKSFAERERRCQLAFERGKPIQTVRAFHDGEISLIMVLLYQGFRWFFTKDGVLITVIPTI